MSKKYNINKEQIGNLNFLNNNIISNNNINPNDFDNGNFEKNSLIDRNIYTYILKLNFINFLKNVKVSVNNKLFLVNDYIFIIKHAFNHFLKMLILKVKIADLNRKVKIFQCKKFFKYTRMEISKIKTPIGNKVTTATAYLFYFNKLKQKFISGLKINIKLNKLNNRRTLLLFGIRNKISILYLYQEMRKIHINKDSFIKIKTKKFIWKNYMGYLIHNKNKKNEIEEGFRLIRRYQYINIIKNIMSKFSLNNLKLINNDSRDEKLDKITKKFLIKKGVKTLRKFTATKIKYQFIENKLIDKTKFNFIQRVKKSITNKVVLNKHLNLLFGAIKKILKSHFFIILYQNIMKYYINIGKLTSNYYKTIFIKRIKHIQENKKKK